MGYYIVFSSITIDDFKKMLLSSDLLPSRIILKDNIDDNFDLIKNQGIKNVYELQKALGSKKKLQNFANKSSIDEGYLTILIREISSNIPKPNKICDLINISDDVIKLKKVGIENTLQLFDRVLDDQRRSELSKNTGLSPKVIMELTSITDLSRIRWVNHTFAYVLFKAGYDSAEKVSLSDPNELYAKVKQLNEREKIYNGHIGLHDMKLCIQAACAVLPEIKY